MRAPVHASPDDIDITMLGKQLRRSLPKLLLIAVAAGALTFVVLSMMAPQYDLEAQLAIFSKSAPNPFSDPVRSGTSPDSITVRMDKEAINTHVRALMSPDLGAKIAAEMKLADRVEFNSALGSPDMLSSILRLVGIGGPRSGETEQDRVLNAYFKHLSVYSPKESRSIGIQFSSMDPELAAAVANKIAETYRASLASQSVEETDEVQKALEPKITKLTEEVAAAESEIDRFRGEANIFKGGQQSGNLNEQQLAELTAELSKAKGMRSEAEARIDQARELHKAGSTDALPDVQKSPLIQNLVQQRVRVERQISELSATLLPGHPRMRQLNADLAGLKRQITAEIAKVVDSLAKEAKVAALREDSVTKNLNELKARVVAKGPEEAKLRSLEADAKSKRSELERLQAQFEANRVHVESGAIPVEAQIVAMARPSSVPSFPKKLPYALLVVSAVLLFGTALVVTRGLLAGVRSSPHPAVAPHMRGASGLPNLGEAPASPSRVRSEHGATARATGPSALPVAEAALRIDGLKSPGGRGVRTIVAAEQERTLPVDDAVGLAKVLAAKGRAVVMVDWSPDGRGTADALGIASKPGITDLLAGTAKFEDVVGAIRGTEVHIIPAGSASESPLDPDHINAALDALDEVYEHILVVARREPARVLFEAIQGRFDAGVTAVDGSSRRRTTIEDAPGTFLGYEVDGIELLSVARAPATPKAPDLPVRRTSRASVLEARAR